MKDKLKAFYEENKTKIIVGSVVGLGVVVTVIKVIDGKSVRSADISYRDDGVSIINVRLKNNKEVLLRRIPAE